MCYDPNNTWVTLLIESENPINYYKLAGVANKLQYAKLNLNLNCIQHYFY